MEEVFLSNNYINSLKGLEDHPYLTVVDLESNDITDIEEIQYLQSLPMLRYLTMRRNPIDNYTVPTRRPVASREEANRNLIVFLLPCLTILNGFPVAPEEKVAAQNMYHPLPEVIASTDHAAEVQQNVKQYARIRANDLVLSTRYGVTYRLQVISSRYRFRPIVLAGSSGVGKRTLTQRLLAEFPHIFGLSVSHTTRKPRPGEENGVHYHFVDRQEMQHMIETGQFVEVVSFFGNWYGNSFDAIYKVALEGKICIMDLEMEVRRCLSYLTCILVFLFREFWP